MKKTNQEIIDAIVDASEFSFVEQEKNCTRFCLTISESRKETVHSGLIKAGLKESHLKKLEKEGVIHNYFTDDYCLHINIKDSFLTDEQMEKSKEEHEKDLQQEAFRKEQKDKCVAMHDELVKQMKVLITSYEHHCPDAKTYSNAIYDAKELLKRAEQK